MLACWPASIAFAKPFGISYIMTIYCYFSSFPGLTTQAHRSNEPSQVCILSSEITPSQGGPFRNRNQTFRPPCRVGVAPSQPISAIDNGDHKDPDIENRLGCHGSDHSALALVCTSSQPLSFRAALLKRKLSSDAHTTSPALLATNIDHSLHGSLQTVPLC